MIEACRPAILVVDDETDTARLLRKLLERRSSASVEIATSLAEARLKIDAGFDVITLDYQMMDGDGLTLLREIKASPGSPPVIMVTGHGDEDVAVAAFRQGASGYVVKDARMPELLIDAINKALLEKRFEETRRQQEFLAALLDGVTDAIIARDSDMRIIYWNRGAEEMYGVKADEALGRLSYELLETDLPHGVSREQAVRNLKETGPFRGELIHHGRRGRVVVDVNAWTLTDDAGAPVAHISINRDITEERRIEERLARILDQLPDAVFVAEHTGRVMYVNRAMKALFSRDVPAGTTLESLRGELYRTFRAGTDVPYPPEETPIWRALRGEASTIDDVEMDVGGTRIPLEVTAAPVLGPGGEVEYAVAVSKDITERRKAESASREQTELRGRFDGLYASMQEGMAIHELVFDDDGRPVDYRITGVNPCYTLITGLSGEEAEGRLASELYGTGEPPYLEIYARVATTRRPETFEVYFPPMEKLFHISVFSPASNEFVTVFTATPGGMPSDEGPATPPEPLPGLEDQ